MLEYSTHITDLYYEQEEIEAYGIDWDGPLLDDPVEIPDAVTVPETLSEWKT